MKINSAGIELIRSREGCKLTAYKCPAGLWSIGYGHTGPEVHEGLEITQAEAESLLQADLVTFDAFVQKTCPVASVAQHSAMVCLCFNIGCEAFSHSSVARRHNAGAYAQAAQAFALWNKSKGVVLSGLVARRAAEAALYLSDENLDARVSPRIAEGEARLRASRSLNGSAVAVGATGFSIASELVQRTNEWRDSVFQLLPYFDQARWGLLGLTVLGLSLSIYARLSERHEGRN